jgi:hypothetical protein
LKNINCEHYFDKLSKISVEKGGGAGVSDCKHVTFYSDCDMENGVGCGSIYCFDCNKSLYDILRDLRAKMEAAEKSRDSVFEERNFLRKSLLDIEKERDAWKENCLREGKLGGKINAHNVELRQQVAELTEKNIFFKDSYKKRLIVEKEIAEMLGLEVDCGVLERIADKVGELQGQVAVMRGALEELVNKYVANRGTKYQFISCVTPDGTPDYWQNAIDALQSTPDTSDRVTGLVELLQDAVSETRNGEKLSEGFIAAAEDALTKWKGCK